MLSFFKHKKTTITQLFTGDYVDIHAHLLPGIDDGAVDIEDTLALLKRLQKIGIHNFILTPHIMEGVWENTPKVILESLQKVKTRLKREGIEGIKLRVAAEYMLDTNFSKILKTEKLLTLKDNKLLVEMSYINPPINLYEVLFDIQIAGYEPVLAHPERYSFYHNNFEEYYKLKEAGCLFQMNILSFTTYYGKAVQKTARKLLKENIIDFVGSDVHHQRHLAALESIENSETLKLLAALLEKNQQFI